MPATYAAGTNQWLGGSGDWTNTAKWSQGVVPGTGANTNDDVRLIGASPGGTITLDAGMFPNGLTNRTITGQLYNFGSAMDLLTASGTSGNPLQITLGDTVSAPSLILHIANRQAAVFNWVNLNIIGTTTASGIGIYLEGNDIVPAVRNLVTTDSSITFGNAPVAPASPSANTGIGLWVGGFDRAGAEMIMTGGSLTITNPTANARIVIGAQGEVGKDNAKLILTNTVLQANQLFLRDAALFSFHNSGISATSRVSGMVRLDAGTTVNLQGGNLHVGTFRWEGADVAVPTQQVNVTGANVMVGDVNLDTAGFSDVLLLNIFAGKLLVTNNALVGGGNARKDQRVINLSGGELDVQGILRLGNYPNISFAPERSGFLNQSGGLLAVNQLEIGSLNGNGYYRQTGGTSVFSGKIVLGTAGPDGRIWGMKEFALGENAAMRITGTGFEPDNHGGSVTDWVITNDGWQVFGRMIFDPSPSVTTQRFLAFSRDLGTNVNASSMVERNFGIGILDLSQLNGSEKLRITSAGMHPTNALYINSLLGQTAASITSHLDSALNLYYFAPQSPGLEGLTYNLASGGKLIPLFIPEPGASLLLLLTGGLLLLRGRRT